MTKRDRIFGALAVMLPLLMSNSHALADDITALRAKIIDMPYGQARTAILDSGWTPFKNTAPGELAFVSKEMYDQGYVEVDVCAPTGTAPCVFFFQKSKDEYLRVLTDGEVPHVAGIEVLDAEGFREVRPVFDD